MLISCMFFSRRRGFFLRESYHNVLCKTISASHGRNVTFLVVERVRITFEQGNIILWVSEQSLDRVKDEVNRCVITGYVKIPPSILVKSEYMDTCQYRNDTILVDSEFWGSYYHTTTDHIVPWFITSRVLHMIDATVQFYAKDGFRLPSTRVEKYLWRFGKCLGVDIRPRVHIEPGCYRKVAIGYMYTFRPVVWPHVELKDLVMIPEFVPWFRLAHETLYQCFSTPSEPIPWLFVRRTHGAVERHIHVKNASDAYVERLDDDPIVWTSVHGLIAVEGATFANQWLMPAHSTLLQLHVPRQGVSSYPLIWHTSLAMYLGHTAVDVVLDRNIISEDTLKSLINASMHVPHGSRCISRGENMFHCAYIGG